MTTETETAPEVTTAAETDTGLSISEAMELYGKSEPKPVEDGEADPDAPEIERELASKEADAESPEKETAAEDQETEPEVPAIEPPRSWSKEAHERWSKLDRETQEFLAARDSEDQKAIKRSFNEAAEQ